ncbi:hypothetical protein CVT24_002335 [Panaeolus cyanescens]|uniref:DUF4203 domain-containing protein n=1 Tax=Panaeolus cyanescens TaxID=181874 RepID=A0A409YIM3_9AGAR|nr:hypothetical protein CVT24_002335 [Panaeolus cyanescens]
MASTTNITTSQLTPLLSSTPYNLAYTLPLLVFSLVVTFAGTFLTLDRTRSFPSQTPSTSSSTAKYNALPIPGSLDLTSKKRKFRWYLEGGIGGLLGGYLFGLHLATAMSVLIPGTTSASMLSSRSFLAIWIVAVVLMTPLAARYRIAATLFYGILGGQVTSISLAICLITHPSLPARQILTIIFVILMPILTLLALFIPRLRYRFLHPLLRACSASAGSFGLVISIALLLSPKEESWANVWERLFLSDGPITRPGWGNGKEKGLSTAWAIFWVAGAVADWALGRWIGECPDEKWDSYLAHYASNLPNHSDRAGTFYPPASIWDKWFPSSKAPYIPDKEKEILFPDDTKVKGSPTDLLSSLPYLSTEHLPEYPAAPAIAMRNIGTKSASSRGFDDVKPLTRIPTREVLKKPRKRRFMGWRWITGHHSDTEAQLGSNAGVTRKPTRTRKKPVVFGEVSSSDDDDETQVNSPTTGAPKRPIASRTNSSSTPTLINGHIPRASGSKDGASKTSSKMSSDHHKGNLDYEKEVERVRMEYKRRSPDGIGGEYSDAEVEVETIQKRMPKRRATADGVNLKGKTDEAWSPGFLVRSPSTKTPSQTQWDELGYNNFPVAVPATPSLIKAMDRIAVAQREAYGGGAHTGDYFAEQVRSSRPQGHTHGPSRSRSASRGKQPKTPLSPLNPASEKEEDVWGKEQRRREKAKRMEEAEKVMEGKIEARGETGRLPRPAGIASDDEDSGDEVERGRRNKAPKWDEFWREVKTKAML